MSHQTVIAFPRRQPQQSSAMDFDLWRQWAEVEISVLGYDLDGNSSFDRPVSGRTYEWRDAFARGLAPHEAAAEATEIFQVL